MKAAAAIACVALVAVAQPQRGGIQNQPSSIPQLSVEEVLLAADRMRADRWYPDASESVDDQTGRINRAADMDILVLASRHSRPDLRYIAVREFGRFETPANVTFLAPFLDDPAWEVRVVAAAALVQSLVDRPEASQESAFAIAAIEERLKREVSAEARGQLWVHLAELPLPAATALKWEREWMAEIQQLRPLKYSAADALLRLLQSHPRELQASTEAAFDNWVRAALAQGDRRVMLGTERRGTTLRYLEILHAMRADNDGLAAEAAAFTCRVDFNETVEECSAPIRELGTRLLNPHNPRHQAPLETAAKNRLHPVTAATAVRKLIEAPGMRLCVLLDTAKGLDVEREVVAALATVKPERYESCGVWDPSQYLLTEAERLPSTTTLTTWVVPATAYEALATRVAAGGATGEIRDALVSLHNNVGISHLRWQVRVSAARVATSLKDVATLTTLAGDDHRNVRAEALKGLAGLKHPSVFAAAINALIVPDAHLTITAASALAGMPNPGAAIEPLLATFDRLGKERRDTNRRARLALLERLGEFLPIGQSESLPWVNKLRPSLTDVDPVVAEAVAALIEKVSEIPTRARPTRRAGYQPTLGQVMAIPPCISISFQGAVRDLPVVLDRLVTPIAIARLVELIHSGYYNNTVLHDLDENIGVAGSPGANNEGGLERVIRDEPGNREVGPQLVLVGHERDYADGRIGIRYRANNARDKRETVLGRILDFTGMSAGATIARLSVGAPEEYRRPRRECDPQRFGIPRIIQPSAGSEPFSLPR